MGKGSKQREVSENLNDNFDNAFKKKEKWKIEWHVDNDDPILAPLMKKRKCKQCHREYLTILSELAECDSHD